MPPTKDTSSPPTCADDRLLVVRAEQRAGEVEQHPARRAGCRIADPQRRAASRPAAPSPGTRPAPCPGTDDANARQASSTRTSTPAAREARESLARTAGRPTSPGAVAVEVQAPGPAPDRRPSACRRDARRPSNRGQLRQVGGSVDEGLPAAVLVESRAVARRGRDVARRLLVIHRHCRASAGQRRFTDRSLRGRRSLSDRIRRRGGPTEARRCATGVSTLRRERLSSSIARTDAIDDGGRRAAPPASGSWTSAA